ncbi:hypothetical protein BD779DRAFT_1394871, partial [Infundibulicybe gibba]
YKLFFLYIEPVSALAGALYAALFPADYLHDLALASSASPGSSSAPVPPQTRIALLHLANLYLLFALVEALVLSSTPSHKTWRRLLACLLIADLGHLATMAPLGARVYWSIGEWNAMLWGCVGFVYLGATMRTAFLLGVGVR